ncbi:MAG: hypothetical protein HC875_20955 [Anaerolineales bacterium]|nr:hypothetical protein [Anaerolineales bacterium]
MTESGQPDFTPQELEQLQQVRLSVLAFQRAIATLPADEYNEARNEQFNQIRLEAKAILNDSDFDKKIPRAMTKDLLAERSQRVIMSRLSGIVMFGVILALLGLGINSIILDDFIINSLGCLVSSGGMLLVMGAFVVWAVNSLRGRVSNLGDLYLSSNALLVEIENVLNLALPGWAERSATGGAEIPSAVDLALDSLRKQAADWQHKLRELEAQQLSLGSAAPLELKLNLDFSQRELERVRQEIDRLQGRPAMGPKVKVIVPPGVGEGVTDPASLRRAKSVTMDMPARPPDQEINP